MSTNDENVAEERSSMLDGMSREVHNPSISRHEQQHVEALDLSISNWRIPIYSTLSVFALVFILHLFRVGKSSNDSLTAHEPDNPILREANAIVKDMNKRLKRSGVMEPIILCTIGGNDHVLGRTAQVLLELGVKISPKQQFSPLTVHTETVGMKRVLASVLSPELGIKFTEPSVAQRASLMEWNLARAFTAYYLNASAPIPTGDGKQAVVWAFAHPRAAYLLPLYQSMLGLERFTVLHIVSNGMAASSSSRAQIAAGSATTSTTTSAEAASQREFKWTCPLVTPAASSNCVNSRANRVQFWAQMNYQVFGWCKRLDVDRYVVVRTEDLADGNKCIARLAKALRLPNVTPEMLQRAERVAVKVFANGKRASSTPPKPPPKHVVRRAQRNMTRPTSSPTSTLAPTSAVDPALDVENKELVINLDLVKRQMELWKYPITSKDERGECEGYPL